MKLRQPAHREVPVVFAEFGGEVCIERIELDALEAGGDDDVHDLGLLLGVQVQTDQALKGVVVVLKKKMQWINRCR